jgi:Uma2 family endonuclease
MAANPKDVDRHYFSLDEYFALEHAGDARYEYWDGDILCMSGGSREHGTISFNIAVALGVGLRGGRCRAFGPDTAILTPSLPPYRYPDVSAGCGELQFKHVRGLDALVNPALIVEVLSPTTAARDQEDKFTAYQAIPSFSEYLLVAQDAPRVAHYRRTEAGWVRQDVTDPGAALALESVGCELKMGDVYEGVTFAA